MNRRRTAAFAGFGAAFPAAAWGAAGGHGPTAGDLFRTVGIAAGIAGIVLLILVEFVWRKRLTVAFYHWLMLFGLLALPLLAIVGTTSTVFEETKTVESCNSCHVMNVFVEDMKNPNSPNLAARHYRYKWIPDKQCYTCHTEYGIHGTVEGKRDGLRHWLLYVTKTYQEPIRFSGSYPNANCLACHQGTEKFERVNTHHALLSDLSSDVVNCHTCHGPPHPTEGERDPAMTNGGSR